LILLIFEYRTTHVNKKLKRLKTVKSMKARTEVILAL